MTVSDKDGLQFPEPALKDLYGLQLVKDCLRIRPVVSNRLPGCSAHRLQPLKRISPAI